MATAGEEPVRAEQHAAYAAVAPLSRKYPAQGSALFQTYVDLKYAQRWQSLEVIDVPRTDTPSVAFGAAGWALLIGRAPYTKVSFCVFHLHRIYKPCFL
jgi:hypothetical protein